MYINGHLNERDHMAWAASIENAIEALVKAVTTSDTSRFHREASEERRQALGRIGACLADARAIRRGPQIERGLAQADATNGLGGDLAHGAGSGQRQVLGWADTAIGLCEDEGCPHYGKPHSHPKN